MVLYELNENAINALYNESYDRASVLLLKAQETLEQLGSAGNRALTLLTSHNLALCYQK